MSSTIMKTTRLARRGNEVVLVLDEEMLEELGLDENSEVEVSIKDDALYLRQGGNSAGEGRFRESAEKIVSKHAGLFRRLAK